MMGGRVSGTFEANKVILWVQVDLVAVSVKPWKQESMSGVSSDFIRGNALLENEYISGCLVTLKNDVINYQQTNLMSLMLHLCARC